MKYGRYDLATGAMLSVGQANSWMVPSGSDIIVDESVSLNHWLDLTTTPPTLMEKTAHPLTIGTTTIDADGEDECVITGIHNPSTVTWPDGFIETVTDGEVRFSVDLAGEYAIQIEAIPYLKETINVSAITPA